MSQTLLSRSDRVELLHRKVGAISKVLAEGALSIDETLRQSAELCGVIPADMKSALISAEAEGLVRIDYVLSSVELD